MWFMLMVEGGRDSGIKILCRRVTEFCIKLIVCETTSYTKYYRHPAHCAFFCMQGLLLLSLDKKKIYSVVICVRLTFTSFLARFRLSSTSQRPNQYHTNCSINPLLLLFLSHLSRRLLLPQSR